MDDRGVMVHVVMSSLERAHDASCMHTCINIYIYTNMYTINMHIYTNMYNYVHTYISIKTRTYGRGVSGAGSHVVSRAASCIHICIDIYIYTNIYEITIYIYTDMCKYVFTYISIFKNAQMAEGSVAQVVMSFPEPHGVGALATNLAFLSASHKVSVCCNVLQCVAVCYSVLQCVAVCCDVLVPSPPILLSSQLRTRCQCVAMCCSVLQCVTMCCSVLQCVAMCWCPRHQSCFPLGFAQGVGLLQRVAMCCNVLQCVAMCCNVLQCVAMCCNVLQCVAVCCNV